MSRRLLPLLMLLLLPALAAAAGKSPPAAGRNFLALCYHDVQDVVHRPAGGRPVMSVSTGNLIAQFSWLRENGYHPVSFDRIEAAARGGPPLPEKAVLLTFDDGLRGLYTRVYPLLRAFGYPAVFAVVGRWLEAAPGATVRYGDRQRPRSDFLGFDELREMSASGLVEIASHSYDLHRYIPSNPRGNREPAAVTRAFDPGSGRYESAEAYRRRIAADARRMKRLLEDRIGVTPRIMVWPYGLDSAEARAAVRGEGFRYGLVLGNGDNSVDGLGRVGRILLQGDPPLEDFVWQIRHPRPPGDPVRVVHVDLDYVYDPAPPQQRRNLDRLLERVRRLGINTVYLQAFADPDGDGAAEALYFPNRRMPVRADLFSRVAAQLRSRAGVRVLAWMPVLAFEGLAEGPDWLVQRRDGGKTGPDPDRYLRLSPFHAGARRKIREIYEDLACYSPLDGVLFHDDAFLTDFEDAGPAALAAYRDWGLPPDLAAIRKDPRLFARWSRGKTEHLMQWTDELLAAVRRFRPDAVSARNLYAATVLRPESEAWFAQSFRAALGRYDQVALLAMPHLEGAGDAEAWLERLARRVLQVPGGARGTVFELQAVRWDDRKAVPAERLRRQMALLARRGIVNFGYYPEDFVRDHPDTDVIRPAFSLEHDPFRTP